MGSQPAAGQEVLVVDADDQVVKGLDKLLTKVGLIVTGTNDPIRARDQLLNKFFAVALVDADTPTPGAGIELLQFARDKSPLTSVVVMTARKSYDVALKAFRAGATDVVLKEPDVVPYLRERVIEAAGEIKGTADRNILLEEVADTHEDFLRRLREVTRELIDVEDRLAGRKPEDVSDAAANVNVVVVDDDPAALSKLEEALTACPGLAVSRGADRAAKRWTSSPRPDPRSCWSRRTCPTCLAAWSSTRSRPARPTRSRCSTRRPARAAARAR